MATETSLIPKPTIPLSHVHSRIEEVVSRAGKELQAAASHLFGGGGKLLRPSLVLLTAQAVFEAGGRRGDHAATNGAASPAWEALYDFAAAAELIHVASLIHDDVIDMAATRRSRPSVNALYDNHTAVLAGDYLFASAFGLLAPHAAKGAITLMTEAIARMCRGEVMQKESLFDPNVSEEAYFERVQGKTAALLAAACEGGARLAGAADELCRALRFFGESLGIAFQIADDILDLESSAEEIGKPACADLRQGIITLPVIRLLQDGEWYERLAPQIRERAIDESLIKLVQEGVKVTGALEWARQVGHSRAHAAAAHLAHLASTQAGVALTALCNDVMARRI